MTTQPPTGVPAPAVAPWRPLLHGADATRALDVAGEIARELLGPDTASIDEAWDDDASVGRGNAGVTLFLAELAGATGDDALAERALERLDVALEHAMNQDPSASLYGGTIGVGWVLSYLEGRLLDDDGDGAADVDALAEALLHAGRWPSVDLIRGIVGIGAYALERLPRPSARQTLTTAVARLADYAVAQDRGLTWMTEPDSVTPERREMFPNGYYDVGIAHGQAGTVVMLAAAHAAGIAGAEEMLRPATDWLLSVRLDERRGFPAIVDLVSPAPPSRLAWCYGDPGVAIALLASGQALGDESLVALATEVAANAAARPVNAAGVVDASLCHGSGGLLHVFNRLAAGTGDERIEQAARTWYGELLARRDTSLRFAGFPRAEPDDDNGYNQVARVSFLEGASGVGLALVAAATGRAPDWDGLLLTTPVASFAARATEGTDVAAGA